MAARSRVLSASKGRGQRDLSVEGASGLGSGGIGVLPVERVLGSLPPARRTSEPPRGERDRKRPWPHRPACAREENTRARVDVSTQEWRRPLASKPGEVRASLSECLLRGARAEAPRLAHATPNRGVTRGWRCLRAIRRRTVGRSPTSALRCWGKAGCLRGGQGGESLSLVSRWAPGVLVDNKLVAEIW